MKPFRPSRITALLLTATILISFTSIVQTPAFEGNTVTDLIRKLKSEDPIKREEAALALGESHDSRALGPLLEVLQNGDENGQVRMSAAMALGFLGDIVAVEPLIEKEYSREQHRTIIAGILGDLGDCRATETLQEALKDQTPEVRKAARHAIDLINSKGLKK